MYRVCAELDWNMDDIPAHETGWRLESKVCDTDFHGLIVASFDWHSRTFRSSEETWLRRDNRRVVAFLVFVS